MSQWTKGKFKQRGPPPALFAHSSPAASNVSLAGGDPGSGATAGASSGLGQPGNLNVAGAAGSASGSGTAATSGMPSLPTLQRTTSRLRQEVSNSSAGGGNSSGGPPPALSAGSSNVHTQNKNTGQGSLTVGAAGGLAATPTGSTSATTATVGTGTVASKGRTPATASFSLPLPLRHASSTRATDRTDALWAEMQATLEEVELSASEGTRVFGPDHDQKLAALRQAQIALAQAWAHSEADEAGGISGEGMLGEGELSANNLLKAATNTATSMSGAGKDDEASASGGLKDGSAANHSRDNVDRFTNRPLEEETQVDILLARKRREANDRYFQRVNRGVLDVVAKLEDVADAMRAVEQESMDIWGGDNDSEQPASIAT